jgi:hypothetical protein
MRKEERMKDSARICLTIDLNQEENAEQSVVFNSPPQQKEAKV